MPSRSSSLSQNQSDRRPFYRTSWRDSGARSYGRELLRSDFLMGTKLWLFTICWIRATVYDYSNPFSCSQKMDTLAMISSMTSKDSTLLETSGLTTVKVRISGERERWRIENMPGELMLHENGLIRVDGVTVIVPNLRITSNSQNLKWMAKIFWE